MDDKRPRVSALEQQPVPFEQLVRSPACAKQCQSDVPGISCAFECWHLCGGDPADYPVETWPAPLLLSDGDMRRLIRVYIGDGHPTRDMLMDLCRAVEKEARNVPGSTDA